MMNKQRLGWIGASIAAGIFPTFHMTFGAETLASPADTDGHGSDRAQESPADQIAAWGTRPTGFIRGESASSSAG
jgi:hypothetical protein